MDGGASGTHVATLNFFGAARPRPATISFSRKKAQKAQKRLRHFCAFCAFLRPGSADAL
jgi:hypothetical protein